MNKTLNRILLALAALMLAPVASAHPYHGSAIGFSAGFFHPFLGLDHLLAMTIQAVGLMAGKMLAQRHVAFNRVAGLLISMADVWLFSATL